MAIGTTPAVSITNNTPGLTFSSPLPTSVGVKATAPAASVKAPVTTLPKAQVAPKDLSSTYANVGGTIYNKSTGQGYSAPDQFFKDSGVSSFDNLKFDTAWKPSSTPTPTAPVAPQPVPQTPAPVTPPAPAPTGPYTPPNQGTTGVSQGGIIGNLLGFAQTESPEVKAARQKVLDDQQKYAEQGAQIDSRPEFQAQATGQEGILNKLWQAKLGADQAALANAMTSQGQQITSTTNAGQLNAPIVNPQTGGLVNPSSNSTTNSTTSGAPLSSLVGSRSNSLGIGTRTGADGHTTEYFDATTGKGFSSPQELANFMNARQPNLGATPQNVFDLINKQEYYNKSTGQGFSTPQALADFVNQQNGNNNANAINVFDMLNQQQSSGVVKPNDPFYQTLVTAANLLATNQVDAANSLMSSMAPAVKAQVIQMAQSQGYNSNVAAGTANAIQGVTADQAKQIATFRSAQQQAQNLGSQFTDLIKNYNLNPSFLSDVNGALQVVAGHTSDVHYQALANYANDIINTYSTILSGAGVPTDQVRSMADSFINKLASGTSIIQALSILDQQANAKIAGIFTPPSTYTPSSSTTNYDSIINQYLH